MTTKCDHRAGEDTCGQISQGWRTVESTDPQGQAGTSRDQKPWRFCPPTALFCLHDATTPGAREGTEESVHLCLSFRLPFV